MPPTRKGKSVTKGKGKASVPSEDQKKDGGLKIKLDFTKKRRRVVFDRLLIFDIGMKITLAKEYNPIRVVRIIFILKSKQNFKKYFTLGSF